MTQERIDKILKLLDSAAHKLEEKYSNLTYYEFEIKAPKASLTGKTYKDIFGGDWISIVFKINRKGWNEKDYLSTMILSRNFKDLKSTIKWLENISDLKHYGKLRK